MNTPFLAITQIRALIEGAPREIRAALALDEGYSFSVPTALVRASQLDQPASGRWLCPGLDAQALLGGKQLFAAARAAAEGGSLSVFASVQRAASQLGGETSNTVQ